MRQGLPRLVSQAYGSGESENMDAGSRDPKHPNDASAGFRLLSASPDVILIEGSYRWYYWGTAHGNGRTEVVPWSLKLDRVLVADDIFDASKDWRRALAPAARMALIGTDKPEDGTQLGEIGEDKVLRLTKAGLCLHYDPYDLGGYISPSPAILPWSAIKPYLRADAAVDPATLEDGSAC